MTVSKPTDHQPASDGGKHSPKDAEKPDVGARDRSGEDDMEGVRPARIDTLSNPEQSDEPAAEIEEKGEPFEGNHA